jgi:hypothetical protein
MASRQIEKGNDFSDCLQLLEKKAFAIVSRWFMQTSEKYDDPSTNDFVPMPSMSDQRCLSVTLWHMQ